MRRNRAKEGEGNKLGGDSYEIHQIPRELRVIAGFSV
jgi:hypothetical protein